MLFKQLDRYILKALLDYFLMGVVVFSFITFFSDTFLDFIQDIQKFGIAPLTALTLVGLQLPKTIALVLPASCFLAVLMVYNNLNNAFEIIALRMSGITLKRLVIPALVVGGAATILAYILNDYVVPYSNQESDLLKQQAMAEGKLPVGRESFAFKEYDQNHRLRQMVYVGKYKDNQLEDSTIIDLSKPTIMQIIQSKAGHWYPDHWEFRNANAYTVSKTSDLMVFNHLEKFQIQNVIKQSPDKEAEEEDNQNLSNQNLLINSDSQPFIELWQAIQNRKALGKRIAKSSIISLWEKITLPLSCLIITLTAIPLALTPPRQGSQRGFLFSLGVLFLYYFARSVSVALGKAGLLKLGGLIPLHTSLMLAAWLPLILMALAGVLLIRQKSRVL